LTETTRAKRVRTPAEDYISYQYVANKIDLNRWNSPRD
jgi:hypothetical protein